MHSSSETLFFENLTLNQGKKNQKKSRIRVSIFDDFPQGKHIFLIENEKIRKSIGASSFSLDPKRAQKWSKSVPWGPSKTMIFNETSIEFCTFSKVADLKN